jgi:hypothetical protein
MHRDRGDRSPQPCRKWTHAHRAPCHHLLPPPSCCHRLFPRSDSHQTNVTPLPLPLFICFFWLFETGAPYAAQAGLELASLHTWLDLPFKGTFRDLCPALIPQVGGDRAGPGSLYTEGRGTDTRGPQTRIERTTLLHGGLPGGGGEHVGLGEPPGHRVAANDNLSGSLPSPHAISGHPLW